MTSAAAEIGVQGLPDLGLGGIGILVEENFGGHNHAVRAISALRGLLLNERCLDVMRMLHGAQTLERGDLPVLHRTDGDATRPDRFPVHDDGYVCGTGMR